MRRIVRLAAAIVLVAVATSVHAVTMNKYDAIVLKHAGLTIDVIGQIGFDPGTQRGTDPISTADNTILRSATVSSGHAPGNGDFSPYLDPSTGEWDGFAIDDFSGLGAHAFAGCS